MKFDSYIVTENSVVANVDNKAYHVSQDHPNYKEIKETIKNGDADKFVELADIPRFILDGFDDDSVEIVGDKLYYNGMELHNSVVNTIIRMFKEGFDIEPMVKFLKNLMQNPSSRSVNELWNFMEAMGLTVTEDGCFLAYKSVKSDYRDKYTGTINNTPGSSDIPKLPRNQVDDDCRRHCSHGYHVGALEYAGPGGWYNSSKDKVIICKVNPADVVSVPTDHSHQKLRCCYYEPVAEYKGKMKASVYSGEVGDDYSYDPQEDADEYEDEYVAQDDLLEGVCYEADYVDRFGSDKHRYFMVEEKIIPDPNLSHLYKSDTNVFYNVELLDPEEDAGSYRTFYSNRLYSIKEFDLDSWLDKQLEL